MYPYPLPPYKKQRIAFAPSLRPFQPPFHVPQQHQHMPPAFFASQQQQQQMPLAFYVPPQQ
jgi:hypothetical protein